MGKRAVILNTIATASPLLRQVLLGFEDRPAEPCLLSHVVAFASRLPHLAWMWLTDSYQGNQSPEQGLRTCLVQLRDVHGFVQTREFTWDGLQYIIDIHAPARVDSTDPGPWWRPDMEKSWGNLGEKQAVEVSGSMGSIVEELLTFHPR